LSDLDPLSIGYGLGPGSAGSPRADAGGE